MHLYLCAVPEEGIHYFSCTVLVLLCTYCMSDFMFVTFHLHRLPSCRSYALIHPSWTHNTETHRGPAAGHGSLLLPGGAQPGACCVTQQELLPHAGAEASSRGGPQGKPPHVGAAVPAAQPGRPAARVRRLFAVLPHRHKPHV